MTADVGQISHIARLAVLAMCARGVAAAEFEDGAEVAAVLITVSRSDAGELPVDVQYVSANGMPIGGMSL